MHTLQPLRFPLAALLLAAGLAGAPASAAPPRHWQTAWISPSQPVWDDGFVLPLGMPRSLHDVTLRQALATSVGGERLRLRVSNEGGRTPLRLGRASIRIEQGPKSLPITFEGADSAVLPPGVALLSDPVALPTTAGQRLVVDLYLPQPVSLAGFHWDARDTTWLLRGDATGRPTQGDEPSTTTRAFLSELLVETALPTAAVVTIGDSITDGNGATPGRDQRWPDHLGRRLAPRGIAVLNAGISGNRLLHDGMGASALARFERDALRHPGVRAVIVLLGTNDIGWPGGPFAPHEPAAHVPQLTTALRQLVAQGHARGVRVIGATLPPFKDALKGTPLEGHFSPAKEAARQALNTWIRESAAFDAVVDMDAVLRDPQDPARLRAEFDSGDHLHPNDAGYRAMAAAVDLQALLGTRVREAVR
ncbi:SGNH/GDSL hydrolase family protein [Ideonella sp. BN130291]|uniref:SGNH/GDSL hydrolase family protein n=1 Tax=Ideonella sp. BN130291 TaxID=3112940 RepID=UPI002E26D8D7|nr:SGNH/GDSL hydrolase family protein [Ideonella sp. BN130291]